MVDFTRIYYFVFGVLTIAGGLMGWVNKRSLASLIAGSICGVLLVAAGFLIPSKMNIAMVIGLLVSVALAGRFIPNYLEKKALFPAGIMSLLSSAGLVLTLFAWYHKR